MIGIVDTRGGWRFGYSTCEGFPGMFGGFQSPARMFKFGLVFPLAKVLVPGCLGRSTFAAFVLCQVSLFRGTCAILSWGRLTPARAFVVFFGGSFI